MNRWFFACVPLAVIGCGMVQEFGSPNDTPGTDGGVPTDPPKLPDNDDGGVPSSAPTFSWLNPLPTGNDLLGIWGTAVDDVWLAGAHGTVARWDGTKASLVYEGKDDEELYAMWGSGKDDMWIAGRAGARGQVIHWNGTSWSPSFHLAEREVHALWGFASNDVWALADEGSFFHFDGTQFLDDSDIPPCEARGSMLRDFWGSSASDLWAVGDDGKIFHRGGRRGAYECNWIRATHSLPGEADPFAKENAYFGIWGSSANDVWAAFVVDDGASSVPREVGFSHFDGTAWRVTQLEPAFGLPPIPREPARRGHRLWGTSANDILAVLGSATWRWNGSMWIESQVTPSTSSRYHAWTAAWGSASVGLMAVGQAGSWSRLQADQSWAPVFPTARREELSKVSVAPDGSAWALHDNHTLQRGIVRWTANGWTSLPPLSIDEFSRLEGFKALSKDDLWVAGTNSPRQESYGYVTRFTNGAWGPMERLPMDVVWAFDVVSPSNAWAVGRNQVARWDGTTWRAVPLPAQEPSLLLWDVKVTADDVWIVGQLEHGNGSLVLRWDGARLQTVHRTTTQLSGIWPNGTNDVWLRGSPGVFHYDGSTWASIAEADFTATDIWGSAPDDVWLPSYLNGRGVLRHWDGKSISTVLEMSTPLSSVSGSAKDDVWFVGDAGATLRYATSAWKPPR